MRISSSAAVITLAVAATPVIIFAASHTNAATKLAVTNTTMTNAVTTTAATTSAATQSTSTTAAAKKTATTAARTYVGSQVNFRWGMAQVTIVVKGNVVIDLSAVTPHERSQSAYINDIAVPMLRKEVLQAKTAAKIKNMYGVSGATMTSYAFYQSLLAALHGAKLA